jgi:hypothetical protein
MLHEITMAGYEKFSFIFFLFISKTHKCLWKGLSHYRRLIEICGTHFVNKVKLIINFLCCTAFYAL